mmetsp:Transcript_29340/g.57574  ORF Transcript_29340/g.57574 Transcript_29340/m.57574 type:complete len:445 (+) Transcript_29340:58-1392(+)
MDFSKFKIPEMEVPGMKMHAEHMWKFLDELADSDPEAYKDYIKKQQQEMIKEKKKRQEKKMFLPEPAFCVETARVDVSNSLPHFINICQHKKCPVIQDQAGKPAKPREALSKIVIPLSVGLKKQQKDGSKDIIVFDVCFHPETIQRSQEDMSFKMFMLELAFQHVEEDNKLKLHRGYKTCQFIYKGKREQPQMTEEGLAEAKKEVAKKKAAAKKGQKSPAPEIIMPFGKAAAKLEEEDDIGELRLSKDVPKRAAGGKPLIEEVCEEEGSQPPAPARVPVPAPVQEESKPMRQVISDTGFDPTGSSGFATGGGDSGDAFFSGLQKLFNAGGMAADPGPQTSSSKAAKPSNSSASSAPSTSSSTSSNKTTPSHNLQSVENGIVLTIELPLLQNATSLDCDIASKNLQLKAEQYRLELAFPKPVDDNSASAKFNKKKKRLVIKAQYK